MVVLVFSARREPTRRGLTLIEVLIALMILLALSALALPSLVGYSEALARRETVDQLSAVMDLSRAEAARRGSVGTLVAIQSAGGVTRLVLDFGSREGEAGTAAEANGLRDVGPVGESASGRVRVDMGELPRGYRLTRGDEDEGGSTDGSNTPPITPSSTQNDLGDASNAPREVRLAVILPTGLVRGMPGVVLEGPRDRRDRVSFRAFGGGLVLTPIVADGAFAEEEPAPSEESASQPEQAGAGAFDGGEPRDGESP